VSAIPLGGRISHFDILEKLGEGGMGAVYKARDHRLDRLVAIKALSEKVAGTPERQARFIQEAKTASALNHPHIVTIYEIDLAGDLMFIAMEYIEGRTLEQLIPQKGLRFTDALRYAIPAADALAAAHAIGIVHRDVKPSNIMVSAKGVVKVLDFGLAKLTSRGMPRSVAAGAEADATVTVTNRDTEAGSILGTVAYMSPEQAEGKEIDARSDIFSFGVMLYEMLTGRRPFAGDTKLQTLAAIVNQEPRPARQLVEGLPSELDRVLARCLRKDPARRFQTMADLKVALEELKEESDSGRLTAGVPVPARKRTWLWAAAGALMVLALAGAWLLREPASAPPEALVPVTSYPGSESSPSFSPDGKQIAFTWNGEKGDNYDIYVKLVGEANALRLTTDPATDLFPVWSPDGKRIAFRRGGATLGLWSRNDPGTGLPSSPHDGIYTVSALGGAEQKLSDFDTYTFQMSWSPDGKWLAVTSNDQPRAIFLLPAEGGDPRRASNPKAPGLDGVPSFSPDGRQLAYAGCTGEATCDVYVQDLSPAYVPRGSARRITHQNLIINGLTWSRDGRSVIYSGSRYSAILPYLWRAEIDGRRPPQRLEIAGPQANYPSVSPAGNRLVFSRNLQDEDIWRYRVGGAAEPLIVSSLHEVCPQFSPDGSRIAFESNRSGEAEEIWVAQADGSKPVQMTNNLGRHQGSPRWSPDGRWIAFDSQGEDGHRHIYVMDASGGGPRRISPEGAGEAVPSWSQDGKWIYFYSDRTGRNEIWRVPSAGGAAGQVTKEGGYAAYESADGTTLFYMKGVYSPLFARPVSGGAERQLLDWVSLRAFVPVDDGIYYIGRRSGNGQYPLQFFQFSSRTSQVLTNIDGAIYLGLSVSPDRTAILFSKTVKSGANLMMIENFM
jgi:Tol biopolymer transport system component/tRNA A-37 threonylcarbamoyl transferase component Bud32